MGNLHIAQSLADNVCLNCYLSLPAHLGTAGIDQHVHHKISGICFQFPLKDFGITASPDPPQSGGNDHSSVRKHGLSFSSQGKRFTESICQLCYIMFYNSVFVMIQPDIFISQTNRIFILVISFYRIFQDSFCKIKAAVSMDPPAHQMVDPLFFCISQIGSSVIQFHIRMSLFQSLRRKNRYFMLFPALFFHVLCNGPVFKSGHGFCQLLHIAFQSFFIQLFREIILPGILCQFLHTDSQNLFQTSVNRFKGRIHQTIIELIHNPDQFHGALCTGCACHCVCKLLKLFFRPEGASVQSSSQHCRSQPPKHITRGAHLFKFLFQNILTGLSLNGADPGTFPADFFSYGFFNTKLGKLRQTLFIRLKKYFFYQVHSHHVPVVKSGKSPLLDAVIKGNGL